MQTKEYVTVFSIPGADSRPIIGNTHLPNDGHDNSPRGALIIAHGFKGYKDYGMFPRIAQEAANAGFIAHRFNFSHSGMTGNIETFERPDLFERDTWNKQVEDLRCIVRAIHAGELPGAGLPLFLFGHSRGGVSVLLFAGRTVDDPSLPKPAGIITAAAPDRCNSLSEDEQRILLKQGFLESPSNRTGQVLRIGKAFLQEQLDEPGSHDLLAQVARISGTSGDGGCPMLFIHGDEDPTVPSAAAHTLVKSAGSRAQTHIIPDADHVFNTPNPFPAEPSQGEPASPQLASLLNATLEFANNAVASE